MVNARPESANSLNLPADLDLLQRLTKAFVIHSGTTAVTSISTKARSSTKSATCTSVMAG
jgi:hypothetical protein